MSEGFKPFFVDLSENDAMAHSDNVAPGRYLVISVIGGFNDMMSKTFASLLAYRLDGDKRLVMLAAGSTKFVGFRGDCILCDKRKPEEGP